MTWEDRKEITLTGLILGLILFVSTLVYLLISRDMQHLLAVGTYLVPIILGYCLLGMFIRWMVYRSTLKRERSRLFSGVAAFYWVSILATLFLVCAFLIPQTIRHIVLFNLIVLLLLWLVDYLYLNDIASELNFGMQYYSHTLAEDLSERPQNEDKFMEEIKNYCKKSNLSLEIMEYGIPAKIKMNSTLYLVELGQYYSFVGTLVYTLEFHRITSKASKNAV